MNTKMYDAVYDYYKTFYKQIEKQEIYKWRAVTHFQNNWDINADDFAGMLDESLKRTSNLLLSGQYFPRKMIVWAAEKEEETVRSLFKELFDLSGDLKERIENFREGINGIIERHKEGKISRSYQDDRAIMTYLSLKYPEKYFIYKYEMFKGFAKLIDYAELPKAGDIELVFLYDKMCNMILSRVLQDEELLQMYEPRRKTYHDPEYHILVQDIVYAAKYFVEPELLEEEKEIQVKEFTLKAKVTKAKLEGSFVDYIEKAKEHKCIGDAGEEFVYQMERARVKKFSSKLAKQVRHVSKLDGDGLGYDILSFDSKGKPMFIEVKTTSGAEKNSIYITANELAKSEECPEQYYMYRVYNFNSATMDGQVSRYNGSLKTLCVAAQTYKVSFE